MFLEILRRVKQMNEISEETRREANEKVEKTKIKIIAMI
jgi:hypothetical protein